MSDLEHLARAITGEAIVICGPDHLDEAADVIARSRYLGQPPANSRGPMLPVKSAPCGDAVLERGDGVKAKAGRFARYGEVTDLYEVKPLCENPAYFLARVRFTHGSQLVRVSQLTITQKLKGTET